jgi:hypothetical protein
VNKQSRHDWNFRLTFAQNTLEKNNHNVLIKNMKAANHEETVLAIRAEVTELSVKVNSPKSPDELLMPYQGREEELLKNLRKLAFKQQVSCLC